MSVQTFADLTFDLDASFYDHDHNELRNINSGVVCEALVEDDGDHYIIKGYTNIHSPVILARYKVEGTYGLLMSATALVEHKKSKYKHVLCGGFHITSRDLTKAIAPREDVIISVSNPITTLSRDNIAKLDVSFKCVNGSMYVSDITVTIDKRSGDLWFARVYRSDNQLFYKKEADN